MNELRKKLTPLHALALLIAVNLILAFFVGDEFGEAWDEPSFYLYGERSYDAYIRGLNGKPLIPEKHIFFIDLRYYGPVYTAFGWKIVDTLTPIFETWKYADLWHLVNFTFFQLSLAALYVLAKRYTPPWTAFGVTALFAAQPLLFGHAFINPKDIPFLTFFLVSVVSGLAMADAIKNKSENAGSDSLPWFRLILAIIFGLYIFTYVGKDLISSLIAWAISALYNAPAESFLGALFSALTGNANRLPVENYIHKAVSAHLERLILGFIFLILLGRRLYLDVIQSRQFRLTPDLRLWFLTIAAGITLGLATSIRILAPFAGLLVAGYAVAAAGRRTLPILIYYFSIAAVTSCLTWPFLWDSPAFHFLETLQVMRDFPFVAEIRFLGGNISSADLPWIYIPLLITIQITIPAVILAWIGFIVTAARFRTDRLETVRRIVLLVWFILPVALQILLKSNVYDNFRQFLFILPPMFVLAGIGFEALTAKWTNSLAKVFLAAICILPGVIGSAALHPYQYIYYNGFAGGTANAAGKFETDYWLTSYREAAAYINENAPPNANILAWGAGYNVRANARADLTVFDFDTDDLPNSYEYAVITTRFDNHIHLYRNAEVVFEVKKNGALLAVVKKLK